MIKRTQNRIAESRWALPICAAYTLLICIISGLFAEGIWVQLALTAVATLLMVELNNRNSLIRIYSRMVSCSFLILTMMTPHKIESTEGCIVSVCFVAFYLALFHAYQDKKATGYVLWAFTAIGIASTVWIQILLFVPVLWVLTGTNILALSLRTFVASIMGILLPYWFISAYYIYMGDITPLVNHVVAIAEFGQPFEFYNCSINDLLPLGFIALLAITGSIHFLRTSYMDKIRTRMIYEMFITMTIATVVLIILQPQHANIATHMLIISTAPLIGHFLALTSTKITNIASLAFMAIALVITVLNLWT